MSEQLSDSPTEVEDESVPAGEQVPGQAEPDDADLETEPSGEAAGEADEESGEDSGGVSGESDDASESSRPSRRKRLEQEGEIAADYLEELLEIVDLDGDLDMDVEGDRATVSIVGANLPQLVGEQGEVLEALQELTRLAVFRETGERSRLMLDVSGHRAQRRTALEEQAVRPARACSGSRPAAPPRPRPAHPGREPWSGTRR